jgi:hypothetical protein
MCHLDVARGLQIRVTLNGVRNGFGRLSRRNGVPELPFDPRYSWKWAIVREEEARAACEKQERERTEREAAAGVAQRRSGAPVWSQGPNATWHAIKADSETAALEPHKALNASSHAI